MLLVYVEEVIIISPNIDGVRRIKTELKAKLKLEDLGLLRFYLGIHFECDGDRVSLTERAYCELILKKFGMENCTPESTPMVDNIDGILGVAPTDNEEQSEMVKNLIALLSGVCWNSSDIRVRILRFSLGCS